MASAAASVSHEPTNCRKLAVPLLVLLIGSACVTPHRAPSLALGASVATTGRHVGPLRNSSAPAVDQVAALLRARPRQSTSEPADGPARGSSGQVAGGKPGQQAPEAKLLAAASNLEQISSGAKSNSSARVAGARRGGAALSPARPQPAKRQAEYAPSRRNEDPWFLDQAPLPLQPYRFSYNIKDKNGLTEQYRQEAGDGKFTTGSYGYVLPDGIYRHVDYVADDRGFHVFLRTSEPGTANQNPADVVINANPQVTAPGVTYNSARGDGGLLPFSSYAGLAAPASNAAAAWNYSSLLPASVYSQASLADLLRSTAAANVSSSSPAASSSLYDTGTLARRPPGSIVNTPARNFTSFAYGSQPQSAWPWNSPAGLGSPNQFQSIAPRPWPESGAASDPGTKNLNSSLARVNWSERPSAGDEQPPLGQQEAKRQSTPFGEFGPGRAGQSNSLLRRYELDNLPPLELSGPFISGRFSSRPAALFTPSRVGPDVLLYDRPFAAQGQAPGGNSLKLNYDNNHVPYSSSPLLELERARSLAHLEQLNAVARIGSGLAYGPQPSLPLLSATEAGTLSPSAILGGHSSFSSSSSSSSSEHRQQQQQHEHHSSRQLVDDANKVLLSKEHKSGSTSASGREQDYDWRSPHGAQHRGDLPPLLPPPPPKFSNTGAQFMSAGVKGAGPPSARLFAPYADEQPFGRPSGQTKGEAGPQEHRHHPQQQQQQAPLDEEERRQSTLGPVTPSSPAPPAEPQSPQEPALPATSAEGDQQSRSQGATKSTPPSQFGRRDSSDEIELQQPTAATKSVPARQSEGGITRTVRMPEDFRTSFLMNDLRSMQNAIGLPQPPRLQRSSDHSASLIEHPSGLASGHTPLQAPGASSLADQTVAARMRRVEDLLRHAQTAARPSNGGGASGSSPPHQASAQQAVAVRASRRELDELGARQLLDQPVLGRGNRTGNLGLQPEAESSDNDQPRRLSTGPVLKFSAASRNHADQESAANETASFEAQRLSNKAARLRADKVSELEKFQQRLRTQQMHLLEQQVKSSDNNKLSSQQRQQPQPQPQPQPQTQPRPSEANSHVKYDEPTENEISNQLSGGNAGSLARKRDSYPRSRRQNDSETANQRSGDSASKVKGEAPATTTSPTSISPVPLVSDLARRIQSWPSLRVHQQDTNRRDNKSEPTNDTASERAKSTDRPIGPPGSQPTGRNGSDADNRTHHEKEQQQQQQNSPNTINLDFINSVTALSVDHLNPFAISSVNPAVQRSSSAANSERLSPHRLALPTLGSAREHQSAPSGPSPSNQPASSTGGFVATSPARYYNSPDLLAALDYHEKRDTSSQLRGLLGQRQQSNALPLNHQSGSGILGAPYMMQPAPAEQASLSNHRTSDSLGPQLTAGSTHLFEAANSPHKSFAPMPKLASASQTQADRPKHTSSSVSSSTRVEPSISSIQRDGFEIRDRVIQMDNHRFYEVVSSLRDPKETVGGFQAFRDPQLSIPANSRR